MSKSLCKQRVRTAHLSCKLRGSGVCACGERQRLFCYFSTSLQSLAVPTLLSLLQGRFLPALSRYLDGNESPLALSAWSCGHRAWPCSMARSMCFNSSTGLHWGTGGTNLGYAFPLSTAGGGWNLAGSQPGHQGCFFLPFLYSPYFIPSFILLFFFFLFFYFFNFLFPLPLWVLTGFENFGKSPDFEVEEKCQRPTPPGLKPASSAAAGGCRGPRECNLTQGCRPTSG